MSTPATRPNVKSLDIQEGSEKMMENVWNDITATSPTPMDPLTEEYFQTEGLPASRQETSEKMMENVWNDITATSPTPMDPSEGLPASRQETYESRNPMFLVFKLMKIARRTLHDSLKETKLTNKICEKKWEEISQKISKNHKDTGQSQKNWNWGLLVAPIVQGYGAYHGYTHPTYDSTNDQTRRLIEGKVEKWCGTAASTLPSMVQGSVEHNRTTNEANNAPLQMQSQAKGYLFQNNSSEESSQKQQIDEFSRTIHDLISRETDAFKGSLGRY